ncbi:AraC family transcriptional regulator [Levilactobacillus brevis]|nr:AraC family transcriptional regulator [Levilactobacillus brevis]
MAQQYLFQTIESNIYLYAGHFQRNFPSWHYPREQHQLFELITVLQGSVTLFMGPRRLVIKAGEAIIITPETPHESFNFSGDRLQFFCFHFNVGDLELKTQIIKNLGNVVAPRDSAVSRAAHQFIQSLMELEDRDIQGTARKFRLEIFFLELLTTLSQAQPVVTAAQEYPEREVVLAQKLASGLFRDDGTRRTFQAVCAARNVSTTYGHRIFKRVYGITPSGYAHERQFSRAKVLLEIGENSIEDIALQLKFSSQASFSKQFKKWSGMTPSAFRKTQQRDHQSADYLV